MGIVFDLNLDPSYSEDIRQQHGGVDGQRLITDLEDQIGGAIHQLHQRHGFLPGVGDRIQVDTDTLVVINARSFADDGNIWFSVQRYKA